MDGVEAVGADAAGAEVVGEVPVEGGAVVVVSGELPDAGTVAWPGVVWAT